MNGEEGSKGVELGSCLVLGLQESRCTTEEVLL